MLHGLCAVNIIYSSLVNQLFAAFAGGNQGFQPLKVDANNRPECYLTYIYTGECLPQSCSYLHLKISKQQHQHSTDVLITPVSNIWLYMKLYFFSHQVWPCHHIELKDWLVATFCFAHSSATRSCTGNGTKLKCTTGVKTQWEGKAQLVQLSAPNLTSHAKSSHDKS